MDSKLTELQRDVLDGFFHHEARFFLTGGGALAGFHLGHRDTSDLDLFTTTNVLDDGERALRATAQDLGATIEAVKIRPEFRRWMLRRNDESVIVDLVLDRAPQVVQDKPKYGIVAVDPPAEILANKLCALLSRCEIRDLVDVCVLEERGYRVEDALPLGNRKDGGLLPAQLAWVLEQIRIGDDARIPGGLPVDHLRRYLKDLINRLSRMGFPA